MKKPMMIAPLLLGLSLSACGPDAKDYDAQAACQGLGHKVGTTQYEDCVKTERSRKMLDEQRREYEMIKQEKEDWRRRGY